MLFFLLIAQNSKPFTEDSFVKNCIIEAVFGISLTVEEAMNIPLSAKTVTSRSIMKSLLISMIS